MLITNQQLRLLQGIDNHNFIPYMQHHLGQYFPLARHSATATDLLKFITLGIEKAKRYGFTTQYEACLFIDVMAALGASFEKDILLGWTQPLLRPQVAIEPRTRVERLLHATYRYLDEVAGQNEIYPVIPFEDLHSTTLAPLSLSTETYQLEAALEALRNFWPSKFLNVGKASMRQFAQMGQATAVQFGFSHGESQTYFVKLLMAFGYDFFQNPLFGSITAVLNSNSTNHTAEKRYQLLHEAVKSLLAPFVLES